MLQSLYTYGCRLSYFLYSVNIHYVTVLVLYSYIYTFDVLLQSIDKFSFGPDRTHLRIIGKFLTQQQVKDAFAKVEIYVLHDLHQPLLGQDTVGALHILQRIDILQ